MEKFVELSEKLSKLIVETRKNGTALTDVEPEIVVFAGFWSLGSHDLPIDKYLVTDGLRSEKNKRLHENPKFFLTGLYDKKGKERQYLEQQCMERQPEESLKGLIDEMLDCAPLEPVHLNQTERLLDLFSLLEDHENWGGAPSAEEDDGYEEHKQRFILSATERRDKTDDQFKAGVESAAATLMNWEGLGRETTLRKLIYKTRHFEKRNDSRFCVLDQVKPAHMLDDEYFMEAARQTIKDVQLMFLATEICRHVALDGGMENVKPHGFVDMAIPARQAIRTIVNHTQAKVAYNLEKRKLRRLQRFGSASRSH
ncbi:unnamed protein product, partial [Mesorhabditis spiculigera]